MTPKIRGISLRRADVAESPKADTTSQPPADHWSGKKHLNRGGLPDPRAPVFRVLCVDTMLRPACHGQRCLFQTNPWPYAHGPQVRNDRGICTKTRRSGASQHLRVRQLWVNQTEDRRETGPPDRCPQTGRRTAQHRIRSPSGRSRPVRVRHIVPDVGAFPWRPDR